MIRVNWLDGTTTSWIEEDYLELINAIADEWNRKDWKEVIDACMKVVDGESVEAFEKKWNLRFERS